MNIVIIGTGYVGLNTGAAAAYLGYNVTCVDQDPAKLALLNQGQSPIHERGLPELLTAVRHRMVFTDDTTTAVGDADIIIIAVGTPAKDNGEADTRYVEDAARAVAAGLKPGRTYTLVVKSTVPIGSNRRVAHVVTRTLARNEARNQAQRPTQAQDWTPGHGLDQDEGQRLAHDRAPVQGQRPPEVHFASNPEFLREGFALYDTFYPDRIVVGTDSDTARATMQKFYRPIIEQTFTPPAVVPAPEERRQPPLITTDPTSAEMIKYASNAFLAAKISFANEMAGLCQRIGADINEVTRGMGLDSRIGPRFLGAGLGWGGSCFPKDTAALMAVAAEYGYELPITTAARQVNDLQRQVAIEKLQAALKVLRGRTIGILGLAFKPGTDDIRESPAIAIIRLLVERGAHVKAHDPIAGENARRALHDIDVEIVADPYELAQGCDGIVLATEWDVYRRLDLAKLAATMRLPVLVDGRNVFQPAAARQAGLTYLSIGRPDTDVEAMHQVAATAVRAP